MFNTSATSSLRETTTTQGDNSASVVLAGNKSPYYANTAPVYNGKNISVNTVTDQGAVMASMELAGAAMRNSQLAATQAQDVLAQAMAGQTDLTKDAQAAAADAASGGTNNGAKFILSALGLLAGAAVVIFALSAWSKKGK